MAARVREDLANAGIIAWERADAKPLRHRFLDPDASAEVIAQKLSQNGWEISIRSVQRVIEEFGVQKKTLPLPPAER